VLAGSQSRYPVVAEPAWTDIVRKGIAGGLVTAPIANLGRRGNTLPGILPLFLTFALIAVLIVGAKGDATGFREACLAGAKTMTDYPALLAVCHLAVDHVDYRIALLFGPAARFIVAPGVYLAPRWT
jgi:uncharacterized membrane protein (GlpM family)